MLGPTSAKFYRQAAFELYVKSAMVFKLCFEGIIGQLLGPSVRRAIMAFNASLRMSQQNWCKYNAVIQN